ncbi:hypothetical protein [Streptomyces sp. URMC 129]|uniref:hypothetical protein n=1 Tax=Streptomyces sp. URMC 129 TaxID=3423407 RepID=UPI003F1D491F
MTEQHSRADADRAPMRCGLDPRAQMTPDDLVVVNGFTAYLHAGQAADNLTTIVRHWDDLTEAVALRENPDWPPTMGIQRLREPDETGDGRRGDVQRLPIRPEVLDAMREITDALTELADHVASQVQRPPVTVSTRPGWTDDLHRQAVALAAQDAADPRRWRIGHPANTAVGAAGWLLTRLAPMDGPFRPLHDQQHRHIADIAAACALTTTRLLRTARLTTKTGRTHDGCGGALLITGGDGTDPAVVCARCERTWTPATARQAK